MWFFWQNVKTTQQRFTLQHNITSDHVRCRTSRDVSGKLSITELEPSWQACALPINRYGMRNHYEWISWKPKTTTTVFIKIWKPMIQCFSWPSPNLSWFFISLLSPTAATLPLLGEGLLWNPTFGRSYWTLTT